MNGLITTNEIQRPCDAVLLMPPVQNASKHQYGPTAAGLPEIGLHDSFFPPQSRSRLAPPFSRPTACIVPSMGGPRRTARAGTSPAGDEGKKISRPPNAWILYRRDKVKLLAHYQQASASAIIARWWAEESPEIKSSYEQRAEIMKAEHALLYPDWQFRPQKREDKQRIREQRKLQREEARKANRRQRYSSPRAQTPYLPTQLPFPVIPNGQEQFGPQGPSPPISAASSPEPCPEPALHPEQEPIPITEHRPPPEPLIDVNAPIDDYSNFEHYSNTEQLPTPPNDWQVPVAPQPVSAALPLVRFFPFCVYAI